ncbi:diguanylate cyclase [Thalassotalea sp. M1531]|uniref:diguanylate cyclase n=1 Tax=Thalassotalea algicola TaxID=2716224 RepID=A0A7Y0L8P9_9GAMM|nr:diguanylate cyclase [Thalassotalea algicola]NMP30015.1 diguanylate cyclase [Thalassotalea algicola]
MWCRVVFSLFLFAQVFSIQANSFTVEHFKSIANDINRNPYPVYLQLLEIEKNKDQLEDEAYLWLLYRKAQAETLLYFHDKFSETVTYAQSRLTPDSPPEVVAAFNSFAGLVAERNGKYEEAAAYFRKAMALAERNSLNYVYTQAKHYLAYTLSLTELYETSLADLQEAYVEAFALDDHFLIAVINETYGAVYGYMNEYEKSIEHYNRALDTYERLGYKPYVVEAIYGLASTYRYMKKYDLAIDKFSLYMDRIEYTPNKEISYFGAYGLGMTYAEKGDCVHALEVIDKALNLKGQVDYDAELYKKRAQCYITLGQLDDAKQSIEMAESIFAKLPELTDTKWALETKKLRGQLAFAQGDFENGYVFLQDYYQRYTQFLIKNSSTQLIRVRAAMELERQNIEVSLLQQRNKVQQLQIAEQESENRQQIYFIVVAVIVLILILAIVINQYRNNKKIFALSITDPLSGSYNRRYIFDCLDRLVVNSQNKQSELAILLFDIDDFKQVNDQYGHPFGDEVIFRVAQLTQETLRVGDIVGRIGGEEFLCILPRTDVKQAATIAERLKENIEQALFTTESRDTVKITVSVGISALDESRQDRATLYVQSDKALYKAKHQGKNQVVTYSDV